MLEKDYIESLYQSFCSLHLSTYSLPEQYTSLLTALTNAIVKNDSGEGFLDETKVIIKEILMNLMTQLMCVNGYVKTEPNAIMSRTFALNSIQFFLEQIGFFVSGVYDYVHDLKSKLQKMKDGGCSSELKNEFVKSGVFMLKNIQPMKVMSGFVDAVLKQNKDLLNLPSIHQIINKFTKQISDTVVAADEFRKAIESHVDFSKQRVSFLKAASILKKKSNEIYNFLVEKHKTIGTYFVKFSQNQKVVEFLSFVSHYIHSISCVSFLTITIGNLDPMKSHECLNLMNQISGQSLTFITSIHKLLNHHSNPNEMIPKIIEMSQNIVKFFKSASKGVSDLISLSSETCQKVYFNKLSSLFSELIESSNKFKDNFNGLVSELKFNEEAKETGSICEIETPITEISAKLVKSLNEIMKSLLGLQASSLAQTITLIKHLSADYDLFLQKMNQIIKSEVTFNKRVKIVHEKVIVTRTMKDFVKYFGEFNKNKENELIQIQASLSAIQFLLGICTLDTMSIQFPVLDDLHEILIKLTMRFYLKHESKIKSLIDSIKDKSEQLPTDVRSNTISTIGHLIQNVFPFCDDVFINHKDSSPTSISFYLQAYQNLSFGLMQLISSIKSPKINQYFIDILLNIDKYQNICHSFSYLFPRLVNLYSYHLSSLICKIPTNIKKLIENVQSNVHDKSSKSMMDSYSAYEESTKSLSKYLESIKDQTSCFDSIICKTFEKTKEVVPKLNELLVNICKFSMNSYLEGTVEQSLYRVQSFLLKFEAYDKYSKVDEMKKIDTNIYVLLPYIEDHLIIIQNISVVYANSLTTDPTNADLNGLIFASTLNDFCQTLLQHCQKQPELYNNINSLKSLTNKILEQSAFISLGDPIYQKQGIETSKQIQQNYESTKSILMKLKENKQRNPQANNSPNLTRELPKLEKFSLNKNNKNSKQSQSRLSAILPGSTLSTRLSSTSQTQKSKSDSISSDFHNIFDLCDDDLEPMELTFNASSNIFNSVFQGETTKPTIHVPKLSFTFDQPVLATTQETNNLNEKLHLSNNVLAQLRIMSDKLKFELQKLRQNQSDVSIVTDILNIEKDLQITVVSLESELKDMKKN